MSNAETLIVVGGASGPAFEEFLATSSRPDFPGRVETVVGTRPEKWGKYLGETALQRPVPEIYAGLQIVGIEQAMRETEARLAVSFLRNEAAALHEDLFADLGVLISNSAHNRMRQDAALANENTNPAQIDQLFARVASLGGGPERDRTGRIITIGNCTSVIASLGMVPIHQRWGIVSAEIKTLQGYSGAGEAEVPEDRLGKPPVAIKGDEKEKIEAEPNRLLSDTLEGNEGIIIEATPERGLWWRGHHEKITLRLASPATAKEVEEAWQDWRAPEALKGVKYGPSSPKYKPIKVKKEPLVYWDGKLPELTTKVNPMRVKVYLCSVEDDGHTITFEVLGDNLALGSSGSAAMHIAYLQEMGYLK